VLAELTLSCRGRHRCNCFADRATCDGDSGCGCALEVQPWLFLFFGQFLVDTVRRKSITMFFSLWTTVALIRTYTYVSYIIVRIIRRREPWNPSLSKTAFIDYCRYIQIVLMWVLLMRGGEVSLTSPLVSPFELSSTAYGQANSTISRSPFRTSAHYACLR